MYSPVQIDVGDGYGSVRPVKVGYGRTKSDAFFSDKRKMALAGSVVAGLCLLALILSSKDSSKSALGESISSGEIKKVDPKTGAIEISKADPGIYMQVWWNTSAGFDKLKWWANSGYFDGSRQPASKVRALLGDPDVATFTPVINVPDAATLQVTVGRDTSFPSPGSDLFETVICVWRGRLEIVNPGEYNVTLRSSPKGAIFTMGSGINMIVNDVDGFFGEEKFLQRTKNFEPGFHKFVLVWKAPASSADTHICTIPFTRTPLRGRSDRRH